MKQFVFLFCLFLCAGLVTAQTQAGAAITWEKNYFDFGDMVKGAKAEHTFKFTNTGSEPLVITNVEVTCGCTTPKGWPRDPIEPGKKAEIIIQFDSTNKMGRQNKVVVIVSNAAAGNSQITFSANVLPKSEN
ncbi:MAG: DUF1573 domain-containing protein [Bacteroidetes bacterium]|nr:DUF1573 domain-containing protein [Bacteroidota bacterium]